MLLLSPLLIASLALLAAFRVRRLRVSAPRPPTEARNGQRRGDFASNISCVDGGAYPSRDAIRSILLQEERAKPGSEALDAEAEDAIDKSAMLYELAYAFVAGFQGNGVPIFLGFGSHIGARRHHAIIPFGEKDIDFHVYSADEGKVLSIIKETLRSKASWAGINVTDTLFGYQLLSMTTDAEGNFTHYIDFWMFGEDDGDDDGWGGGNGESRIKCVGRKKVCVDQRESWMHSSYCGK